MRKRIIAMAWRLFMAENMRALTLGAAWLPLVFGSGCAAVIGNKQQSLSVEAVSNGAPVSGVACKLINDAGVWYVTTPGSATVQKSSADLNLTCDKDKRLAGQTFAKSSVNGAMFGNLIFGVLSPITAAVDWSSGAGFDYPQAITVEVRDINSDPAENGEKPGGGTNGISGKQQ